MLKTSNATSLAKQNFGLQPDEFQAMLEQLKLGDEILFESIFLAQFEDTIKYLQYNYKVSRSQAYDATMDGLLKFRTRLLEGKITYANMRFLFTQIASQFLMRTLKRKESSLEGAGKDIVEQDVEGVDDAILDLLDKAWNLLAEKCRGLLENYYYKKIPLKQIALTLGKSDLAVRKQKQRCLEALREEFRKRYTE